MQLCEIGLVRYHKSEEGDPYGGVRLLKVDLIPAKCEIGADDV